MLDGENFNMNSELSLIEWLKFESASVKAKVPNTFPQFIVKSICRLIHKIEQRHINIIYRMDRKNKYIILPIKKLSLPLRISKNN
jgi:hypothetical protein